MRSITYRMLRSLILTNQFLTPSTNGNGKNDMIAVIKAVGGLQWGAEDLSLLSRLNYFESRWVREAVEKKELIEVHVLRGGLRIIPPEDYPYFFAGTREVIERIADRRLIVLEKMTDDHRHILHLLSKEGPLTRKEVRQKTNLPNCGKLINQLLVEGKVIRAGRRKNSILIDTLKNWLPQTDLEKVSPRESRLWMARKFLTVYGPSTASEIAHWAGWTAIRGREVLSQLTEEERIEEVALNGSQRYMLSSTEFPPEENIPYVRLLHNDDEVHLACSGRCRELFGFDWKYRFSTTAAVLQNNRIIGEMVINRRKNILFVSQSPSGVDRPMLQEQVDRLGKLWHATCDRKE